MVVSSLFAENLTHAHQQTQVSLDLVFLGHEHLLPVCFAGHDIHPDIKRNFDGQVRAFSGTLEGTDGSVFDTEMTSSLDLPREIELKDGPGIACTGGIETKGEKHQEGFDRVGSGNKVFFFKLFRTDSLGNAALPEDIPHLSE